MQLSLRNPAGRLGPATPGHRFVAVLAFWAALHATAQAQTISATLDFPTKASDIVGPKTYVAGKVGLPANQGLIVNTSTACIYNGRFFANDIDLSGSTTTFALESPAPSGAILAQEFKVATPHPAAGVVLAGDTCGGSAPYAATFNILGVGTDDSDFRLVTVDFDGNGTSDYTSSDPSATIQYVYKTPGIYRAKLTVFDATGGRFIAYRMVAVQAPEDAQVLIATIVDRLRSLVKSASPDTITLFTPAAQVRYKSLFSATSDKWPLLDAYLQGTLTPIVIGDQYVEFGLTSNQGNMQQLHRMTFIRDKYGAWKIESF